jgi:hypothetical protein
LGDCIAIQLPFPITVTSSLVHFLDFFLCFLVFED